jgi:hypothetical protein
MNVRCNGIRHGFEFLERYSTDKKRRVEIEGMLRIESEYLLRYLK